jgi:hypothetical protein
MAMRVSRADVDMKIRLDENKQIEPAMPHNIFGIYPTMKRVFMTLNKISPECPNLHETCLTTILEVKNVPLKPAPETLIQPAHKQAVHEGHDSLDNCYPTALASFNIGSNIGLLQICRMHYETICVANAGDRYSCINVDANIFDRILKVQ